MVPSGRKSTRVLLASLLLLLILLVGHFGAQTIAPALASAWTNTLASNQQIAAIQGGQSLLLNSTSATTIYIPFTTR